MRKIAITMICVLFGGVAAYIYATPYITAYEMNLAIEDGDVDEFVKYVDFPSVRQNMKNQVEFAMDQLEENSENNSSLIAPLAALGTKISSSIDSSIANKAIDFFITPEKLAFLLSRKNAAQKSESNSQEKEADEEGGDTSDDDVSLSYESFDRFVITLSGDNFGAGLRIVLTRKEIVDWKVSEVILPPCTFALTNSCDMGIDFSQ